MSDSYIKIAIKEAVDTGAKKMARTKKERRSAEALERQERTVEVAELVYLLRSLCLFSLSFLSAFFLTPLLCFLHYILAKVLLRRTVLYTYMK